MIRSLYLRLLAIVYFSAFAGLLPQLAGLYGDHGILPVSQYLQAAQPDLTSVPAPEFARPMIAYLLFPSLLLFSQSFAALQTITVCGAMLSLALFFGFCEPLVLLLLYLFYLSVVLCGQDFLSFQWDMLLLEAGFISIFLGRSRIFEFSDRARRLARVALIWLTFRLMFSSGWVKLVSEPASDSTWLSLTALKYHFETQPVPNPLALFLNAQPLPLSRLSCAAAEMIELAVPFMILCGRRARLIAAIVFTLLQMAIAFSGNYGFFNLLTIALSLNLIDDCSVELIVQRCKLQKFATMTRVPAAMPAWLNRAASVIFAMSFILVIFASSVSCGLTVFGREFFYALPPSVRYIYSFSQNWGISSTYGLFAVMTRERPELIIEGSQDAQTYVPYEFYFKPCPLDRAPPVMLTYMPRLDWQLWFEALNSEAGRPSAWFRRFLARLKAGSPDVEQLLACNPFAEPPRYLRVSIYKYKFTSPAELFQTGKWWKRTAAGHYELE